MKMGLGYMCLKVTHVLQDISGVLHKLGLLKDAYDLWTNYQVRWYCQVVWIDSNQELHLEIESNERVYFMLARSYQIEESGGRLNKKDGLTRYGDSHVKDKTS